MFVNLIICITILLGESFLLHTKKKRPDHLLLAVDSLLNLKILDLNKLKAVAEDNSHEAEMMVSGYDRIENIVGKRENAVYQQFLVFQQCFQTVSSTMSFKV